MLLKSVLLSSEYEFLDGLSTNFGSAVEKSLPTLPPKETDALRLSPGAIRSESPQVKM